MGKLRRFPFHRPHSWCDLVGFFLLCRRWSPNAGSARCQHLGSILSLLHFRTTAAVGDTDKQCARQPFGVGIACLHPWLLPCREFTHWSMGASDVWCSVAFDALACCPQGRWESAFFPFA